MAKSLDLLIFIPTYNEKGNPTHLMEEFVRLGIQADVLFMDDSSPDGTGEEMDQLSHKYSQITVIHRSGKLGIGTAHKEALAYAYEKGYEKLLTMDADFTHPPEFIPKILSNPHGTDFIVGSRHIEKKSIEGWSLFRRIMTRSAHFMTTYILGLPFDSTNAFRLYNLKAIPKSIFQLVESRSYSFFFESLFILHHNGISISEIPMRLPPREAGNSKMQLKDAIKSITYLFELKWKAIKGQKTLGRKK